MKGRSMILHQDDHWLAVDLPIGMAAQSRRAGELGAIEWLELYHGWKTRVVAAPAAGVSGVLLLGLGEQDFSADDAVVVHEFMTSATPPSDHWEQNGANFTVIDHSEHSFRIKVQTSGLSVDVCRLAAESGTPILGDKNNGGQPWPRLALHVSQLQFPGIEQPIHAPSPPSFTTPGSYAHCRDLRGLWLPSITNTFRAIHRDEIPGLPAAVDVYADWFDAVWFDEEADQATIHSALDPILEDIRTAHGCLGGTLRIHRRNPHQRSLVIETEIVGDTPPARFTVEEHGLKYEISLTETQHTGLFLDQRDTRRRLALIAKGRRLANLFAYTCSFSVAAAAAGVEVAFSVDLARACLETGKTNFALNNLAETQRGKFVKDDVRKWLARQQRRRNDKPNEYRDLNLVVCDPPVFASSKEGGRFSVEKEWEGLARVAAELMGKHGLAVFANNHRGGDHRRYLETLTSAFSKVTELAPPLDFPRLPGEPPHVRTFWCES